MKPNKHIYGLFFIAFIILIFSSVFMIKELSNRAVAANWVRHSYDVITQINALSLNLSEAERQFQLYANFRNKESLGLYKKFLKNIRTNLISIRQLTQDNLRQQDKVGHLELRLNKITELIQSKMDTFTEADLTTELNQYETVFSKIGVLVSAMNLEEQELLKNRTERLDEKRFLNYLSIVVSTFLAYIFLILSCVAIIKLARKNEQQYLVKQKLEQEKLSLQEAQILILVKDILERKEVARLLAENEEMWKYALENAQHGVWDWRVQEKKIYFSRYWKLQLGYEEDEITNEQSEFETRVHPDDIDNVWRCVKDHFENKTSEYVCEVRFRCKDGSYKWMLDRGRVVSRAPDGTVLRAIGTHTDISALKEQELNLKHLAEHDTLTGLVNRPYFEARLDQALLLAKRDQFTFAVFFIDIDGFKPINDLYGHRVGDLLLRVTATRLQNCLRDLDTCSRYGGDEFIVLLEGIHGEHDVIQIAKKIMDQFSKEIVIDNISLMITLSIGIAIYPKDGEQSLIEKADKAMYYVKNNGKNNFKLYDKSLTSLQAKPKEWHS